MRRWGLLLTLCWLFFIPGQDTRPQVHDFSFAPDQKALFRGVPFKTLQATARDLLLSRGEEGKLLEKGQYHMAVSLDTEATRQNATGVRVTTSGAIVEMDNATGEIRCYNRDQANERGHDRLVTKISGWKRGVFRIVSKMAGNVRVDLRSGDRVTLRIMVTSDAIVMIENRSGRTLRARYDLQFYPGYTGVGRPVAGSKTGFGKQDFSYLFLDNYGGFGVYLVDQEARVVQGNSTPTYVFSIPNQRIFWTAICPPREFRWQDSWMKPYAYQGAKYSDNDPKNRHNEQVDGIVDGPTSGDFRQLQPYPNRPTFREWSRNRHYADNVRHPAREGPRYADVLIAGSEILLYNEWNLAYTPRSFSVEKDGWKLFEGVIRNAHDFGFRIIFYTAPFQFYAKSSYHIPNAERSRKSSYDGRDFPSRVNDRYPTGIPFPTDMSMRYAYADPPGSDSVRHWPENPNDPPGNPEGGRANRKQFLAEVAKLVNHTVPGTRPPRLDGVYVDGLFTWNIPESYILMRALRELVGDERIIFLHSTPRPGNDGYLPQIDAYATFGMFGENGISGGKLNEVYLRFFQGTYNISNVVGILARDYSWYVYPPVLVDKADTLNLRLMAFPAYGSFFPHGNLLEGLQPHWRRYGNSHIDSFRRLFRTYAEREDERYRQMRSP